jgi:hypothetical protein
MAAELTERFFSGAPFPGTGSLPAWQRIAAEHFNFLGLGMGKSLASRARA